MSNKKEAIDMLVEAGANIEARDRFGNTPLHCASHTLTQEAVLCLLKHGATVNALDKYLQTPLMIAAANGGTRGAAETVDALLRAAADETIANHEGRKASNIIGVFVDEDRRLADDVECVRRLLANAPADRAWRRRGYLVLCRAHPDRLQQNHHWNPSCRHRTGGSEWPHLGGSNVAVDCDDWAVVASNVLRLKVAGIFREIVEYL
eukprot:g8725.t1